MLIISEIIFNVNLYGRIPAQLGTRLSATGKEVPFADVAAITTDATRINLPPVMWSMVRINFIRKISMKN